MTNEEINNMKYKVCCPLCDNNEYVRGADFSEADITGSDLKGADMLLFNPYNIKGLNKTKNLPEYISKAMEE